MKNLSLLEGEGDVLYSHGIRTMKLLACALFILEAAVAGQEKKTPVPDAAALKAAEQTVRELFKEEYAKKAPADRRLLAHKFLIQGKEAGNTPATQYVLFSQAVDLSVQAGDIDTALGALGDLTAAFAVNPVAQRVTALAGLAKVVKTPEDLKTLARAHLDLLDEAVMVDDFESAAKVASDAGALARRVQDKSLIGTAEAKAKDVAVRKSRFDKIKKAKESLDATPEDPAANLAVGQYTCFVKGDWVAGLAFLVKASESALKTAALKDAANPDKPDDQVAIGDLWWDLADSVPTEDKAALHERAGFWYRQASAKVAGIGKAKIDKRLAQVNTERIARGLWVDVTDPSQMGLKGKAGDPFEMTYTGPKGTVTHVDSKPFPAGEYDGFTMRLRFKMDEPGIDIHYKGPSYPSFCFIRLSSKTKAVNMTGANGAGTTHQIVPLALAEEYVLTVVNSKGEDSVYLNGTEIGHFSNASGPFDSFRFYFNVGTTTIDKFKLRKR